MFRCFLHRSVWLLATAATMAGLSCRRVPDPPSPDDTGIFAACVTPGTSSTLDIVSFNVEGFPKAGYTSVTALSALIKTINPDVVALQEVASQADFNRLVKLMPGWSGVFYPVSNDEWNLAYLVKDSEIEIIPGTVRTLFEDDSRAFPRPPFEIKVKHRGSGKEILLINLHLKCCGGAENESSRRSASQKLKDYLDLQRPYEAVVILGDYNDEISSASAEENPFINFIVDASGYRFADMAIAKGSQLWWSYPSWPSHIDHILVTDELFPAIDTTVVLKVSPCYPDYNEVLSDHRPLGIRITPEEISR
ncbi:MAG: endonuclease/exonuclease/phosphatase family protein [Bacteroidota bacterium]|nr:endonuclease/exonuclease/phosphatase family protein [Bacteroidota bacterium]